MMNILRITLAGLASLTLMATGCDDKAAKPGAADKTEAPSAHGTKVAAAKEGNTAKKIGLNTHGKSIGGEAIKLNGLVFGGTGYDAEFNEALDSWTVEQWAPNDDGGNDLLVRIYVNAWDSEWPKDLEGFSKKLMTKDFLDYGSVWTVDAKKAAGKDWIITGASNDGEDNEVAFAVRVDALDALCRGYVKIDVAEAKRASVRDAAIKACMGSTLKK